ncbi:MAG: 30S ribosomal protein S6 [Candidatus Peribacteraceae bacterium]|nr:30S ribosomal protein S6 [Candidatus Peribacteraceae bacterium]
MPHTLKNEDARLYEFCVLYPYPMPQKDEAALLKEIDSIFAEAGATMVSKDAWGRRGLAYTIGGYTEGVYVIYYVEMLPAKLAEVDQALKITKGLLRHMAVKPPKNYEIVSYAKRYEEWLERRHVEEQDRENEKTRRIEERVVEKAKRDAKRTEVVRKKPVEKKAEAGEVGQQLDKLLSSDTLDI